MIGVEPDVPRRRRVFPPVLLTLLGLSSPACHENEYVPPPPPKVTIAQPLSREVTIPLEFTGRTAACESVELRARVSGLLQEMHFKEGAAVEAGELLFTIEPDTYQAALNAAEATLTRATAAVEEKKFDFDKTKDLFDRELASDQEYLVAKTAFERALGDKQAAEAEVATARLNLSYTEIKAPIAGLISRSLVDQGNLVGQGEPTLLTTIIRWDPIYVYFTVSERDVLEFLRRRAQRETAPQRTIETYIRLADGTDYPIAGHVDYSDNQVDPSTGTITARAVFDNPDHLLAPGIFARVRIPLEPKPSILVPESAMQRDLAGYFLMTIDSQGMVERANVSVAELVDGLRIITDGIEGDDWVIVRGLQRVRPDIRVDAEKSILDAPAEQARTADERVSTSAPGAEH